MDTQSRLRTLTDYMELEPAEDFGCSQMTQKQQNAVAVSSAQLPNGKQISLLKTLLTSACERNCYYCPFRSGRDFRRAKLSPDEMARAFMMMYRAGIVQGMFLSSGVAGGGKTTQDRLLATAELLRNNYKFHGYLHLKIMPGAEFSQVERAMQLANRVSVNLEAPNKEKLVRLAPHKNFFDELMRPLLWVEKIRRTQSQQYGWNGRWPSATTQFVVGAVGESDLELLSTTQYLYQSARLRRAYFSAFRPVIDTPLENQAPVAPIRQQRLYQASFLLRDYQYSLDDLPIDKAGYLPTHLDPKTAWAQKNLTHSPVEINRANYHQLLRIPGIGPKGAKSIIAQRHNGSLRFLEDLRNIGINPKRAIPFILLNGKQPDRQLSFW